MKLNIMSGACKALCVVLSLGGQVAQAETGLATFFQTFKKAKDLQPGSLREYLSKYPEHSIDVRAYIEDIPTTLITETGRKALLAAISPNVDSQERMHYELSSSQLKKDAPVSLSSNQLPASSFESLDEVKHTDQRESVEHYYISHSDLGWSYRFHRGPVMKYRFAETSMIEVRPAQQLVSYQWLFD